MKTDWSDIVLELAFPFVAGFLTVIGIISIVENSALKQYNHLPQCDRTQIESKYETCNK